MVNFNRNNNDLLRLTILALPSSAFNHLLANFRGNVSHYVPKRSFDSTLWPRPLSSSSASERSSI